jgi:hypothetical protein
MLRDGEGQYELFSYSEFEGCSVPHGAGVLALAVILPDVVDLHLVEDIASSDSETGFFVGDFFVGGNDADSSL